METQLEDRLIGAFARVESRRDIAPEHPDGQFTIPTDGLSQFADDVDIEFVDSGVKISFPFASTDPAFIPDEGVARTDLEGVREQHTKEVEVREERDLTSEDGYLNMVRPGENHDHTGDHDVYPGDVVVKQPLGIGRFFGSFSGCREDELEVLEDFVTDDDALVREAGEISGVTVLTEIGGDETGIDVIGWLQSFCKETLEWGDFEVSVVAVEVNTFTDQTRVTVRL